MSREQILAELATQLEEGVEGVINLVGSWDEGQFDPQVKEPARSTWQTPDEGNSSVVQAHSSGVSE
jgi:hypothetical protein